MNIEKIDSGIDLTLKNTPGLKKTEKQIPDEILRKKEKKEEKVPDEEIKTEKMSQEELEKEIENLNKVSEMLNLNRELAFSVHEKTGRIVVKVMNRENNEVIRQIPEQKFLDVISKFRDVLGLIVDDEV
ncbi:MAG: hypothetical protein C0601_03855 [Candidatus Muiribacterium halophilum]|uniref:Flagellar biosynthesis protein FlaG n=1 Tax=Muiribacterium halophilum TaxID=2053465 RepID=A0A2N5ZJ39_MUIH1|nr:MAG: hypothetical protein C0601_03855 [Candidatus Muirbacterium halophilum]